MNSRLREFTQAGFTLVELLIVVIILAILAAIVIPQFSSSSTDAQEAALDSNLAGLRSAIELYKAQHSGVYPGVNVSTIGATACTGGAPGTGAVNTAQAWADQLLLSSDSTGHTCTVTVNDYRFGPYLRKGIPADPITQTGGNIAGAAVAGIAVQTTGAPLAPAAATGGWIFDTKSGQIVMNSNARDRKWTAASPTTYASH
jgi:prepilin-type N-terminal cleavage/methylation domain-containing protein